MSGTMCGIDIRAVNVTVPVPGETFSTTHKVYARRDAFGGAVGGGDSGGPLYLRVYDGSEGRYVARPIGLVDGPLDYRHLARTTCRNQAAWCNAHSYYSELSSAQQVLGFTVVDP